MYNKCTDIEYVEGKILKVYIPKLDIFLDAVNIVVFIYNTFKHFDPFMTKIKIFNFEK